MTPPTDEARAPEQTVEPRTEWDCDGQECHCHGPSICPDCGCLHNEAAAVAAPALDVERLAKQLSKHYPIRIDESGFIICQCDVIVDGYDNGWWRHAITEYARLSQPSPDEPTP